MGTEQRDLRWYVVHAQESALDQVYKDTYGKYVRIVRQKLGKTRTQLAKEFGLNRDLLTALEDGLAGADQMTGDEEQKLIAALGVTFDRFVYLNPEWLLNELQEGDD